jgi:hypothetical protein
LSGYSGALYPDIPDYEPDNPDIAGNFTRRLFLVVGLILIAFVDSLEHNYHNNTCGSKSLNFKIKSNSSNKFETEASPHQGRLKSVELSVPGG